MATIKDVAQRAGVSIATVSNYINQTKPVSKATSRRIQQAISELQYAQNLSAKSLKSNSYTDIGVVLPTFNDPYYVQIFQGIEAIFQNSPYFLNLAFTYDIPEVEAHTINNLLRKQICGLILVTCRPNDWRFYYENFSRHDRPVILLDRAILSLDSSFISFDNRAAIERIATQLFLHGAKKLQLLTGPQQFTCEEACVQGFRSAHEKSGVPFSESSITYTTLDKEDAFRKTVVLMKDQRPDVFLCTSQLTATGICEALRLLGFTDAQIPVVTLGEEHWNRYTHSFASYSTARPALKLGATAAKLLIDNLKSPMTTESQQILLPDSVRDQSSRIELPSPAVHPAASENKTLRILMLDTPLVHSFTGLLRNFEIQTGIRTEVKILPHNHLYDAIVQSAASINPAEQYDVYMYDIPWLSPLADQGILGDLTETVEHMDISGFLPDCLQYFSAFKGRYYGIPFMYAPQILYYRRDLFNDASLKTRFERIYGSVLKPPATFKEFNAIAEFFTCRTDAIRYGISIPAAYEECLAPELYMRLRANGSSILSSDGSVRFDTPQTLKSYINFMQSVPFAKPDYRSATDVSIVEDFLRGETAMLISYPSFLTDVSDLRRSSMIGAIGYNHIPGRSPLLGGWSLGISNRTELAQEASEFVRWTCSQQMGNYFALMGGQSVIAATYDNDELVKLYPWLPLYHDVYSYTSPMLPNVLDDGRIVSSTSVDQIVCRWAYRMMDGTATVVDAIANTQRDLEEFFSRRA